MTIQRRRRVQVNPAPAAPEQAPEAAAAAAVDEEVDNEGNDNQPRQVTSRFFKNLFSMKLLFVLGNGASSKSIR